MHRFVRAARTVELLGGEIRYHFIHIHIDRDTSTATQYVDWKLIEMLAANQRVARVFDSAEPPRVDNVRIAIGTRRRLLHNRERANVVGIVAQQTR